MSYIFRPPSLNDTQSNSITDIHIRLLQNYNQYFLLHSVKLVLNSSQPTDMSLVTYGVFS